jgi:hypothetical protein
MEWQPGRGDMMMAKTRLLGGPCPVTCGVTSEASALDCSGLCAMPLSALSSLCAGCVDEISFPQPLEEVKKTSK